MMKSVMKSMVSSVFSKRIFSAAIIGATLTSILPLRAMEQERGDDFCMHACRNDSSAIVFKRPVYSTFTLGMGSAHMADTYLSLLHYSGFQSWFGYSRLQAMKFNPQKWVMRLGGRVNINSVQSPTRNLTMTYAGLDVSWGMMRRFSLRHGFSFGVGGATSIEAGALINRNNGNNPVSARASWTIDIAGYGSWHHRIGRLPVTWRVEAQLPVVGMFFSPEYGELYYEIYLGNNSGLVHPAWWGSFFKFDTNITLSLHLRATTLQLGYRFDMLSTSVNHLVTRDICHSFTIGVATEWISIPINTRHLSSSTQIISATY